MDLFNIICGVCSIIGLLVSLFTASRVIKISNTFKANKDNYSKVINKGSKNTYKGDYVGRDNVHGTKSGKQK